MFRTIAGTVTAVTLAGWFSSSPPGPPPVAMPTDEARFCSELETAEGIYEPLSKKYYAETNGLVQERIAKQMAELVDNRNLKILKILGDKKPHISKWAVRVREISVYERGSEKGTQKYIDLSGVFPCALSVSFEAEPIQISGPFTDFLAGKKDGDIVALTATLIPHDATANSPQRAIEWSGFQSTSMSRPGYRGVVERLTDYVPPS